MFFSTGECKEDHSARSVKAKGFRIPLYLRSLSPAAMVPPVAFIHAGAAISAFFTSLPLYLKGFLTILIATACVFSIRGILRRSGLQLVLSRRGDWFLVEATGQSRTVRPVSGLILHINLVLLTVRDESGRLFPFVFTPWNTDADTLRRLRVRLRYSANE